MANTPREKLKQAALIAFVTVGVILAGLNWAGNLDERDQTQPSFYRPTLPGPTNTPEPTPTRVATRIAPTSTPAGPATPMPTIED